MRVVACHDPCICAAVAKRCFDGAADRGEPFWRIGESLSVTSIGPVVRTLPSRLQELPRWLEGTEGFSALLAALQQGRAATVDGAWNASASLVAATLATHVPHTLLVVLAHPRDVDAWDEDLYSFSGLRVVSFPAWD